MIGEANPLTWDRWDHIVDLAERLNFPSLFRSDHYFVGKQKGAIDVYLSFVVAAQKTRNLRFGPIVSPVTFRRPVDLGRMGQQLDALSNGRFVMGLGAGWNVAEHETYGIDFPSGAERYARLGDAIKMMRALWGGAPASYDGKYYRLHEADFLPRPPAGRPPILIGGNGPKRTLRAVAEYADEWNAMNESPEQHAKSRAILEAHCEDVGRDPASIARSMFVFGLIGPSQDVVDEATRRFTGMMNPGDAMDLKQLLETQGDAPEVMSGGTEETIDFLGRLAELGVQEVQFEHFITETDDVPEYIAAEIAPKVADL